MDEGRENPSESFVSKLWADGRLRGLRAWMNANWAALAMLSFIFILALFLRSYFAFGISQSNGYIVSGGSDSYYWRRIIDYSVSTGKQLFWDPLTAYPVGIRNPRPPFYSMSVVVPAVIGQGLFKSLNDAVGFIFIWSTAFWGALTVIPTYLLGKETFGKRAGLVAAFFLAVMPAHIQRSILSDADHDAIILFFIVLTFYFILRAVKAQQHLKWVESWRSLASIRKGLVNYFRESKTAVLFSLMAGAAFGTVMMIWVGFAYAAVLILAYYVVQVLFNKFRGIDSTSVTLIIFLSMGFGFLLALPVYDLGELMKVRFDVPAYIFLAAILFGGIFVVSRDLPWTIVLPAVAVVVGVGVVVISFLNPALGQAILSGQGYFVKSKLYSTIAEARAPVFSELALSFGMVTFFMSLIGLIWAIIKLPKRANAAFILMVVWLGAAIFMAISAGRFMFNAAPAFAISSAWVLVIIVDKLNFNSVRKSIAGAGGSFWQIFRKSVKVRHIFGALFLAFLIILPNVWYSVDAAIPSETKQKYDLQIYKSFPSFMRPGSYDVNGSQWYLGAFGYQLPLPTYYFPAAWSWFAKQDTNDIPVDRPAFVAWWDYGFEAIQEGQHPTVADNFQNGYQVTGNAIMAQSETDEIAIFAFKLIQSAWGTSVLSEKLQGLFEKYGVSVQNMTDILAGPGQPIIDEVLSDPLVYGPMASDLDDTNARIVAGMVELSKMGIDKLVPFYGEVCAITGWNIGYFMVDSRMFPLTGQSTGIFYAPAKLSDRRLDKDGTPIDFYVIKAVLQSGAEVDLDKLTASDVVSSYVVVYQPMFFKSMFYRAMVGYSGSDVGQANGTVPGWSNGLTTYTPMPGWNMSHFKMVYRTVYYNPYPTSEIVNHQDAWVAMNIRDGMNYSQEISAGTRTGYVDQSASSYYRSGAVFLKYYPGAIVNGTLTTTDGMPAPNVRVTVADEFGIPHQSVMTDAGGHYSVIAPAGNLTLTFSTGAAKNQNLVGSTTVASVKLNVTEEQGMRAPYDFDGDGILDYYITKDVVIKGTQVSGDIFFDVNKDGNYTSGADSLITGGTVYATDLANGRIYSFDAAQGSFSALLPPGAYTFSAAVLGRNITSAEQLNVTFGQAASTNLGLKPGTFIGTLYDENGTHAAGVPLNLTDEPTGYQRAVTTNSNGSYTFNLLVEGRYSLSTTVPGMTLLVPEVVVTQGNVTTQDATLSQSTDLRFRVSLNGGAVPYAVYMISDYYNPEERISGIADAFGMIDVALPRGLWTVYATYFTGSERYAGAELASTEVSDSASGTVTLVPASDLTGALRTSNNLAVDNQYMSFERANGARIWVKTDTIGGIEFYLPEDTYGVTVQNISNSALLSTTLTVQGEITNYQFKLVTGAKVTGTVSALKDAYSVAGTSDLAAYGELKYQDVNGNTFVSMASQSGSYSMVFPLKTAVEISLGDPGYSQWRQTATFDSSSTIDLVATPDDREVHGHVTLDGVGLRGIQLTFQPDRRFSPAVTTTTGAEGFFSVLVPPSQYAMLIDQATGPAGGQNYQFNSSIEIVPGVVGLGVDIQPTVRLEMFGSLSGAGSSSQLVFEGPEVRTVNVSSTSYSVFLEPGTYSVYATSTVGSSQYANMTSVDLSISSRQHDLVLSLAHKISGTAKIGSTSVTKQVTITAESSTGPVVHSKTLTNGVFSLPLPPGSYTVSFLLEDLLTQGTQKLYVEYFDQATVSVGSSDQTVNPDLQLRMDNSTFSGTVYGPDGTPMQAMVNMTTTGVFGTSVSFLTAPDGTFNELVQPGDYTAYVTSLQDMRVALMDISISRNTPLAKDIALSDGRTVSGTVTAGGVAVQLQITISSGSVRLTTSSDSAGDFRIVLPPANYTLSATTTQVENGLTILYTGSSKIALAGDNQYLAFAMTRQTRHGVSALWNQNLTQSALPGVTVTYVIQILNTGNTQDTYLLSYNSQATYFVVSFPEPQVSVDFGTDNSAYVEVLVTPSGTVTSGTNQVPIQVRTQASSGTRADLNLDVNVLPVRSVTLSDLGSNGAVSTLTTQSKFNLTNSGNIEDTFSLQLTNSESLRSLGWSAAIVDAATSAPVERISLGAFQSTVVGVSFTAIRDNPDPTGAAIVLAYSINDETASNYTSVPIRLPDLSIGSGDLQVKGNDVSYQYNIANVYLDIALVITIASLAMGIFYMRRRKGLGRKSQTGGAKK